MDEWKKEITSHRSHIDEDNDDRSSKRNNRNYFNIAENNSLKKQSVNSFIDNCLHLSIHTFSPRLSLVSQTCVGMSAVIELGQQIDVSCNHSVGTDNASTSVGCQQLVDRHA